MGVWSQVVGFVSLRLAECDFSRREYFFTFNVVYKFCTFNSIYKDNSLIICKLYCKFVNCTVQYKSKFRFR
jgi:hypothetical protein